MKSDHPRITLLGSNSGNNVGDAAILASILDTVSAELPDAEFLVPSTKPSFIEKNYGDKYNVKAINVMPWTASIRLLGIPTLRSIAKSDVALITDGIIFDVKLFNPAFNFLITLIFLTPWAKLWGCKMACYSCGIGPLESFWGRLFARWVINDCDLVLMRENDSKRLCYEIGVKKEVKLSGDAAFLNQVSSDQRAAEIAEHEGFSLEQPLFGINVTCYIDRWLKKSEKVSDRNQFLQILAEAIREVRERQGFFPLIFSTHPMDLEFAKHLAQLVDGAVISSTSYLSHDMQALMKRCELFIGMRFHSVVLASAVGVPVVGLIYAPKVRGFMRLLGCQEYGLELAELNRPKLVQRLESAWIQRLDLSKKQMPVIGELKHGARKAAVLLRETFFENHTKKNQTVPEREEDQAAAINA